MMLENMGGRLLKRLGVWRFRTGVVRESTTVVVVGWTDVTAVVGAGSET